MVTLFIDNSECQITGLKPDDFVSLRSRVSYRQKTGRTVRNKSGRYIPEIRTMHLMDRRGCFPTGLLYIVDAFVQECGVALRRVDKRIAPKLNSAAVETLFIKREYQPYPEQIEAALAAFTRGRGIITAPTGVGKSAIAALICDAFRVPTLIVVPSLELKRQLTDSLRSSFGDNRVGPLVNDAPRYLITVENVDALDTKRKMEGIDLVIVDEFHHSGARTYRDLNKKTWSGVYHKFGLTATPFRANDDERLLLESVLSEVIYRIDYKLAVANGYIVPLEAYYVDLPVVPLKCNGRSWHGVYNELVVNRKDRNQLIATFAKNLHDQGISTLVLTKQINHGEILQGMLLDEGASVPFVKGENDDNRDVIGRFSCGDDPVMIGTAGVVGEGVDTKAAEWVFLATTIKSKNAFMQMAGRVFRRFGGKQSGKLLLFRDASHKWTLSHFNACVKYLAEEYGVKPVKIGM